MKLFLALLLLLLSTPAFATTYYVNKAGSNGNSCGTAQSATDANAKLTIAGGLGCLSGGDTLIIGDGTYNEQILSAGSPGGGTRSIPNGSIGAPTTIKSENPHLAVIKPTAPVADWSVINLIGPYTYIVFDGLYVDAASVTGNGGYYLTIDSGPGTTYPTHVTITNSYVKCGPNTTSNVGISWAVTTHNSDTNHTLQNTTIANCNDYPLYATGGSSNLIEGNIFGPMVDNLSQGNTEYCVVLRDSNNVFRNNTLFHCINTPQGGHAFILDSSPATSSNNLIYNNIFYDNQNDAIQIRYGATGTKIYNNTIYGSGDAAIRIFDDTSGAFVKNNILYNNGTNAPIDDAGDTTISNNLTTDPSFVCGSNCATNPDFHLFSTSAALPPCGTNLAEVMADKDGITRPNPPSCGAYEVPSGVNPGSDVSEDFESYAATTNINGLNGGTGWTQTWQVASGTATVETSSCLTGKAFTTSATSYVDTRRLFAGKTGDFTIQAKICLSIANPDNAMAFNILDQSGTAQAAIGFNGTNLVSYAEAANVTLISGFSANTPYTLRFHFDTVNHANQVQFGIGSAEYGAWENTVSPFTSMAGVFINNYATNAHVFSVDDINDDAGPPMLPPPPTTNVGIRARMRAR